MANHKLSPEENARIVAAFFVPGVERCIDTLKELLAELQGEAAPKKVGGRRIVKAEQHDEALRRLAAGERQIDIARDLGLHPSTLYNWVRRELAGQAPPQPLKEYWTAERRKEKGRQIKAAWRKRKKAEAAGT